MSSLEPKFMKHKWKKKTQHSQNTYTHTHTHTTVKRESEKAINRIRHRYDSHVRTFRKGI